MPISKFVSCQAMRTNGKNALVHKLKSSYPKNTYNVKSAEYNRTVLSSQCQKLITQITISRVFEEEACKKLTQFTSDCSVLINMVNIPVLV